MPTADYRDSWTPNHRQMPPRRSYEYSERAGRFRDATTGRFVPVRAVRAAVDRMIDGSAKRVRALTEQFRQRAMTLGEWEAQMREEMRAVHLAAVEAAKGGRQQMSQAAYGLAGQKLRAQYEYLRALADDIAAGRQFADGRLTARATLYSEAARASYQDTTSREMAVRGFTEERNVLDREAAHCVGAGSCPEQTARGWVPIGALIPLGSRVCRVRDRCVIQYRNPATGEIAA